MRVSRLEANLLSWLREGSDRKRLQFVWLGQAGFLLRAGSARIVIDPYLSDSLAEKYRGTTYRHERMMPPPVAPSDLAETDLVLCSHAHTDHMDPGTIPGILQASPRAVVVAPRHSARTAYDRGVPVNRLLPLNADESVSFGSLTVTALPSCHEEIVHDDAGNSQFLGFLVSSNGHTIYHAGDTIPHPEIAGRLERRRDITLALLPVNGRDRTRKENGVPGNMTVEEALDYHAEFGFGVTVLHHFGMFDFNTADPADLRRVIDSRGVQSSVIIPDPGIVYELEE